MRLPTPPQGRGPQDWAEWQANRFGTCLFTPQSLVMRMLPNFADTWDGKLTVDADGLAEKDRFIDQLYKVHNTTKTDFDYVVLESGLLDDSSLST